MTCAKKAGMAEIAAAGALVLGLIGVALCWLFPFGAAIGACGCILGLVSWLARGGHLPFFGTAMGAVAVGASAILGWNEWVRWFES